jgi:hypothetical protein
MTVPLRETYPFFISFASLYNGQRLSAVILGCGSHESGAIPDALEDAVEAIGPDFEVVHPVINREQILVNAEEPPETNAALEGRELIVLLREEDRLKSRKNQAGD